MISVHKVVFSQRKGMRKFPIFIVCVCVKLPLTKKLLTAVLLSWNCVYKRERFHENVYKQHPATNCVPIYTCLIFTLKSSKRKKCQHFHVVKFYIDTTILWIYEQVFRCCKVHIFLRTCKWVSKCLSVNSFQVI